MCRFTNPIYINKNRSEYSKADLTLQITLQILEAEISYIFINSADLQSGDFTLHLLEAENSLYKF